jgi:dCTP deaminase
LEYSSIRVFESSIQYNLPPKRLRIFVIMILTDKQILDCMQAGSIVIEPFDINRLGSNSYDVHLGRTLATYDADVLDARKHNTITTFEIPDDGYVLMPERLYLGVTHEYTETHEHVPFLEGKSSVGRLGIDIHATAGKGDVGFCNYWTLEISVKMPVRVYAGMPIGQLIYFEVNGEVINPYNRKASAKYNERTPLPVESMMWKNVW